MDASSAVIAMVFIVCCVLCVWLRICFDRVKGVLCLWMYCLVGTDCQSREGGRYAEGCG